jgi:signal transduction histidine kinase
VAADKKDTESMQGNSRLAAEDSPQAVERDIAAVRRIGSVPGILELLCRNTSMGFAAVARVTDALWTACVVKDDIAFGLKPGTQLDLQATICAEARALRAPVAFDSASQDPIFCKHPLPGQYGIESFVSVPIILHDGRYFGNLCALDRHPAKVSSDPVIAKFEAFAQLIANELDRTEREQQMEAQLLDERAASVLREQFIAVLGHDLRNPLSAIYTSSEMLVRFGDGVDVKAIGQRIRSSARRMTKLIDDVMDFTRGRLGSGMGTQLAVEPHLAQALTDVVVETTTSHPDRAIRTDIAIDVAVVCDRSRMQQLLSNLLGNAIDHGLASEPIEVNVSVVGDELLLSVSNAGPQIAADHLTRIFEPYWRPPSSAAKGGLGLGLHICSQIAAAHGGRMSVVSVADGLTTFTAIIPVGAPATH